MKRRTPLLLITGALAGSLVLSACASGSSDPTPEPPAAGGDVEIGGTIEYAYWGGPARNEKTQAVINMFQDANSGATVTAQTADFGSYWQRMSVQTAGGNLPCVPQMQNRSLADYADRGALLALDDLVESGAIDVSGIPETVVDSGRGADGNLYMIPYGAAFHAMLFNATMVAEAGLELPPEGYDWDWYADWAVDASKALPEGVIPAPLFGNTPEAFQAWARSQEGEDLFADGGLGFEADTLRDFWNYVEDLREQGATATPEQSADAVGVAVEQGTLANGNQMATLWSGNALASVQASIDVAKPGNVIDATSLPSGPEGLGNAFYLSGLSISENCDNPATAAAFIDFFINNPEASDVYASDNGANVVTANLERLLKDPAVSENKKKELALYQYIADQNVPAVAYPSGYQTIWVEMFARYYEQISFGQTSVDDAVDAFIAEAEGEL